MNPTRFLMIFLVAMNFFQLHAQEKADSDNSLTSLQIPAGDINLLLDTYEKFSGKTLIRDANIPPGVNVRILVPGLIPKNQALRLLESVLMLNGYALVPSEDNSIKVINNTANKNARSENIVVYANLADLPKGDQIVTYFMQLQYISAQEAYPIFQAQTPLHSWGSLVPVNGAQALVITENASTIKQMARLKELIDVPPAKLISRFVSLERADAERVAETVTKLIEDRKTKGSQNNPESNAGAGKTPALNGDVSASSELNERSLVSGTVQLVADPRTNRILVVTRPINFEYIRSLIGEFDNAVSLSAPLDRPLKYLVASEILPVLETLLLEGTDDKTKHSGSAAESSNVAPPPGTPENSNNINNNNGGNGNGSNSNLTATRTLQDKQNTAPQAILVGKTRLIADNQANSIIAIGPPENLAKVKTILDSLDKKPMQVYLSTVIGQLTLNDSSELAIDILHKYSQHGDFGTAGAIRTRTDPLLDPGTLNNVAAFAAIPAGLTLYGAIGSAVDYYVKALASTNRFKLISRPVVYTTNNKGALIASGQKIAVPTSTLTALDNGSAESGSVVSNIQYTAVELKLEVVPTINSNREVTLKIRQSNDSVVGNRLISGNLIPTIGVQTVETTVTVKNGTTIVLGGLITEDNDTSVNGVPYLKDIPVLGYLFKGTTKNKNRSELIIMIQPVVVGSNEEEGAASQGEVDRNKFGPESKAFSDNVPYLPPGKNNNVPLKKPARGLSPAAPANTPKTTPVTPTSGQLYP